MEIIVRSTQHHFVGKTNFRRQKKQISQTLGAQQGDIMSSTWHHHFHSNGLDFAERFPNMKRWARWCCKKNVDRAAVSSNAWKAQ